MKVNHLQETKPAWFAIRTRARSEKFVQKMLTKKGIHAYVPLQTLIRRYTKSTRKVEKPLLNGYVFVHIIQREYLPVLQTPYVAGFVQINQELRAIPETEIAVLRRITMEDAYSWTAAPGNFDPGELVVITAGNLAGMRGNIVKIEGKRHFQVLLETIGYSLIISIDALMLQKVT